MALETPRGEHLSFFADRAETPAEAKPLIERRAADVVAYWEVGNMAYALTGQAAPARIMELAGAVAPAG